MTEREFINGILPALAEAAEAHGGLAEWISYKEMSDYTSVYFQKKNVIFRVKMHGTKQYISVPALFEKIIPEEYPVEKIQSVSEYVRLPIDENHSVESYVGFLTRLTSEIMDRIPNDFDCCSRYMECSNAKVCIHPDKEFSLLCGYRKILNSGRIFYGINRNID